MISEELAQQLQSSKALPSPPGVVTSIIELANDPHVDMDRIAKVLSSDPATMSRVLRIANSPMYAMSREIGSLSQALMILGLNATVSLALSFSLFKSWQHTSGSGGLDYTTFWKRALIAASATRPIAARLGWRDGEDMFLAAMIQDIGVMALDRAIPDLYADLGDDQIRQSRILACERERIGTDHAEVSAWLLERWKFPKHILDAVRGSHDPESSPLQGRQALFVRAVAFSAVVAEIFLKKSDDRDFSDLARVARAWLGLDTERVGDLIAEVGSMIPEAESVFETRLLAKPEADGILEDAREALLLRNLLAQRQIDDLARTAQSLREKTATLEQEAQRDPLTGLFNRAYLDRYLQREFDEASVEGAPLSIAFADVDRFKSVNDTHGHTAGDQVLMAIANALKANVRQTDVIARFGGEEFILVFPSTDFQLVHAICERITRAIASTRFDIEGRKVPVTISMGLATHNDGRKFETVAELISAADKALYSAKLQGRNRNITYDSIADSQIVAI